jgi:uncharacterized protein
MLPRLRANDVDGAVRDGARAVMQVWRGENVVLEPTVPSNTVTEPTQQQSIFSIILFFAIMFVFITLAAAGKRRGGSMLGPFAAGTIYGGGFGGHRGGFGGGFGGFGGGGGGGFSGGGAGGSW